MLRKIDYINSLIILLLISGCSLIIYTFFNLTYFNDFAYYYNASANAIAHGSIYNRGFFYTPITLFIFIPFTKLSLYNATSLWAIINILLLGVCCIFTTKILRQVKDIDLKTLIYIYLMFFFFHPNIASLKSGNINILILTLIIGCFYFFQKRQLNMAGILLGIATVFKIIPGVLLIYFWFKRGRRVVISAIIAMFSLLAASVLLFGIGIHKAWINELLDLSKSQNWSQTIFAALSRMGYIIPAYVIVIITIVLILICTYFSMRCKIQSITFALFLSMVFVVLPVVWQYYGCFLTLPFILLTLNKSNSNKIVRGLLFISYLIFMFDTHIMFLTASIVSLNHFLYTIGPTTFGYIFFFCAALYLTISSARKQQANSIIAQ